MIDRAARKRQPADGLGKKPSPQLDAWLAAKLGDIEGLAEQHAESPALLNQASADDGECSTALMTAAAHGQLAAVNQLLAWGADPLAKHPVNGMDALMLAARNGRWDELKALLPVSDVHARDINGLAALDYANSGHGNERISARLRERMLLVEREALSQAVVEGRANPAASDTAAEDVQSPRRRARAL